MKDIVIPPYSPILQNELYVLTKDDTNESRLLHIAWYQLPEPESLLSQLQVHAKRVLRHEEPRPNGNGQAKKELERMIGLSTVKFVSEIAICDEETKEIIFYLMKEMQHGTGYKPGKNIIFSYGNIPTEELQEITRREDYERLVNERRIRGRTNILLHLNGDSLPDLDTLLVLTRHSTLASDILDATERYNPEEVEQTFRSFYGNILDLGEMCDVSSRISYDFLCNLLEEVDMITHADPEIAESEEEKEE